MSGLLLVVFALACFGSATALVSGIVPRAEIHMTSGKVLAAALLALGIGALVATTDPHRHRLMITVAILFALFAAAAIVYRLHWEHHLHDPAKYLLFLVVGYPLLALVFYPFGGRGSDWRYDR